MLPLLAVCVVSALMLAVINKVENVPGVLAGVIIFVFSVSLTAIGIMGLIVIIGRFYRNTMTDTGYLTMTLPLNSHQFIWGEIIVCFIWFVITALILFATLISSLTIMDMLSLPESLGELGNIMKSMNDAFKEHGVSAGAFAAVIIEGIIAVLLYFAGFCLRFYSSMAVGQLFSKHRGLLSVIAYMLIGFIAFLLFVTLVKIIGGSFDFEIDTMGKIAAFLGMFDLAVLAIDAILYFPTSFLIGKRLNLT